MQIKLLNQEKWFLTSVVSFRSRDSENCEFFFKKNPSIIYFNIITYSSPYLFLSGFSSVPHFCLDPIKT